MSSENDSTRRMTISAARRMLGMTARNYTDEDIQEILSILYGIAEEGYDAYLDKPEASKKDRFADGTI